MKLSSSNKVDHTAQPPSGERASVRIVLVAATSFLLGAAATAVWFEVAAKRNPITPDIQAEGRTAAEPSSMPSAGMTPSARTSVANLPSVDPAVVEIVKQMIPNYASLSLDDGEKILRTAALQELASATKKTDAQVKAAQEQLLRAQNGQSAADQQAALKQLQQAQTAATETFQQVAARLQAQIAALRSLKTAPQ